MRLTEILAWAIGELKKNNIEDPRLEAQILLSYALALKRTDFVTRGDCELGQRERENVDAVLERRIKGEPTAYIVGNQKFMSLDFFVDRSVLIPRPETELLVEAAVKTIRSHPASMSPNPFSPAIVDVGTGSGCIAVCLAKQLPDATVVGIDSSPEAVRIAKKNAHYHQVGDRCRFIFGNLLDPINDKVDMIISNPPYVPTAEIAALQPEIRDWEPRQALDGGEDGLDYIRQIIYHAPIYLSPSGLLLFEFGYGQAQKIIDQAKSLFREIKIIKDYAGIERIFQGLH